MNRIGQAPEALRTVQARSRFSSLTIAVIFSAVALARQANNTAPTILETGADAPQAE